MISELIQAGNDFENAKAKHVGERRAKLSTHCTTLADLCEKFTFMKRSLEAMVTIKQTFNDCGAQAETWLESHKTELVWNDEDISELIKVGHKKSMALTKHKNSLMNTLRKKVDLVEERDEMSKSVASLNLLEGEKMGHADKLLRVVVTKSVVDGRP